MGIFNGEKNLLIQEYSKNPINNYDMDNFTIKYHEGNFICGDDITVFLLIEGNIIKDYSYSGNTSTVSLASASLFSELIIGRKINEILKMDYKYMANKGLDVSNKRKRAVILPVLAVRNALHNYLDDNIVDDFDDLLDDD